MPEKVALCGPDEKQCKGPCHRVLPLTEFWKNRAEKDGLSATCKECLREYKRKCYQRLGEGMRTGNNHKPPAVIEQIHELTDAGVGPREIARRLGISKLTVARHRDIRAKTACQRLKALELDYYEIEDLFMVAYALSEDTPENVDMIPRERWGELSSRLARMLEYLEEEYRRSRGHPEKAAR